MPCWQTRQPPDPNSLALPLSRSALVRQARPAPLRLLLVAVLVLVSQARALAVQPQLESRFPSVPPSDGFVVDVTNLLDASALDRLNARILAVQKRTGGDVGVVLLRDLEGRAPADMGVSIYRWWGVGRVDSIGSSRRDLGALLLIVPKEVAPSGRGECWITTGRGAEGELHDADAGEICRKLVIPHLRELRYEDAVAAGIDGIAGFFDQATVGATPLSGSGNGKRSGGRGFLSRILYGGAGVGGFAGLILLIRRWRRLRPRQCPRGHGKMFRLSEQDDDMALVTGQQVEEEVGSVDYDVWVCPVCDERRVIRYKRWSRYSRCKECNFVTMTRTVRVVTPATVASTGVDEVELDCKHCGYHDVTRRIIPRVVPASSGSGSSGGGGGGGGGGSFGGSGSTGGGGGGSSY